MKTGSTIPTDTDGGITRDAAITLLCFALAAGVCYANGDKAQYQEMQHAFEMNMEVNGVEWEDIMEEMTIRGLM
jgi:hypothetical protein